MTLAVLIDLCVILAVVLLALVDINARLRRLERFAESQVTLNRLDDKWKRLAAEIFRRLMRAKP